MTLWRWRVQLSDIGETRLCAAPSLLSAVNLPHSLLLGQGFDASPTRMPHNPYRHNLSSTNPGFDTSGAWRRLHRSEMPCGQKDTSVLELRILLTTLKSWLCSGNVESPPPLSILFSSKTANFFRFETSSPAAGAVGACTCLLQPLLALPQLFQLATPALCEELRRPPKVCSWLSPRIERMRHVGPRLGPVMPALAKTAFGQF